MLTPAGEGESFFRFCVENPNFQKKITLTFKNLRKLSCNNAFQRKVLSTKPFFQQNNIFEGLHVFKNQLKKDKIKQLVQVGKRYWVPGAMGTGSQLLV